MKEIIRFIKRNWKKLLIALAILIVIIIVIKLIVGIASSSKDKTNNDIITLDGSSIQCYEDKDEAEANAQITTAGTHTIVITSNKNADLSNVDFFQRETISQVSDNTFEIDITNTVTYKVTVGGDGSFVGFRLGNDIEILYFTLGIENTSNDEESSEPNSSTTANTSTPLVTIYFGDDHYTSYASEKDAQDVVEKSKSLVLPESMVKNGITLRVEPTEGVARVFVKPCMINENDAEIPSVRLNADSNWTGNLDVSAFYGNQVTLMIKVENSIGDTLEYRYISFWIPLPNKETETQPEQ